MRASEIAEHFVSRADWVDPGTTVDRVVVGDANVDVGTCLVTWMPSMRALRAAAERGVRVLIGHEPTFWEHWDRDPDGTPTAAEKLRFIREHDLTVVRLHDTWDRWPGVGIPWAWARFLGLPGQPVAVGADGYQHRYDIEPVDLEVFSARVADRCAAIGEPAVQVTGGPATVSRIGIGTGCGCRTDVFRDMGCDCSIVCDDGSCYWGGIQMADDMGHPVIRVNHGTSEEPGMRTLTDYINAHLDGVSAELLAHGSTFRLVGEVPRAVTTPA